VLLDRYKVSCRLLGQASGLPADRSDRLLFGSLIRLLTGYDLFGRVSGLVNPFSGSNFRSVFLIASALGVRVVIVAGIISSRLINLTLGALAALLGLGTVDLQKVV